MHSNRFPTNHRLSLHLLWSDESHSFRLALVQCPEYHFSHLQVLCLRLSLLRTHLGMDYDPTQRMISFHPAPIFHVSTFFQIHDVLFRHRELASLLGYAISRKFKYFSSRCRADIRRLIIGDVEYSYTSKSVSLITRFCACFQWGGVTLRERLLDLDGVRYLCLKKHIRIITVSKTPWISLKFVTYEYTTTLDNSATP